ncbi:MAG: 4-aminobutyrate aminotransferase [Actinomycetota bacterium]|jgi:4-aminobutyrate aminotransferase|nr:4-aminobutyrate aminotransferase [Actinomycetota bacterium]
MTSGAELLARHRNVLPSWVALYYEEPIALVRGEGRRVWDSEGKEYLDFFGGILTTMCGHSVPEIVEAVTRQAEKLLHTSTLYLIEPQIQLAEKIAELSPIPDAKVFFTTSGTEANDLALLLATSYRRSNQVLALRNSYHGRSFAAMSITGNRYWSASALSPVQTSYVHSGYRLRSPFGHLPDTEFIQACTADLTDVIETMTSGDVACMIAEPIQGVGGFCTPPDGFFTPMKEVLDRAEILYVSDEVQTGWGRTGGHYWGIDAHDVTPDIVTFAKGLGNGLSIGGVVARADIMECLNANSISTFGGNPLSTVGALATIEYALEHDLQANTLKQGTRLMTALRDATADSEVVAEVRGKGLMIGIELVKPGGITPNPAAAGRALEEAKTRGLLVGKGGLYGNVVRMAPPMSLTSDETEEGLGKLIESLKAVEVG